jgi:Bacterial protein of unknown function (DUF885)
VCFKRSMWFFSRMRFVGGVALRLLHPTRYARILELRAETELALGDKFDRLAFNNFLLDQGMLPPDLLAKAVREQFVPAQLKKS